MYLTNLTSSDPEYGTTVGVINDPENNSYYIEKCQVEFEDGEITLYNCDKKTETYQVCLTFYFWRILIFQRAPIILINLNTLWAEQKLHTEIYNASF